MKSYKSRYLKGELIYEEENGVVLLDKRAESYNYSKPINDSMNDTFHPMDGKVYDSKSSFRAATRALGGYEVGNDWVNSKPKPPPEIPFHKIESFIREKVNNA